MNWFERKYKLPDYLSLYQLKKKTIKKIDIEKSKQKGFCMAPESLISCKYNFFTIFHGKKL